MSADTVAVTKADYEAMIQRIADLEDTVELLQAQLEETGPGIPEAVVCAELEEGLHPIAAWRRHFGLSAQGLAERAEVSAAYLSEIENGRKPGSIEAHKAIAEALGVPVEYLLPAADDAAPAPEPEGPGPGRPEPGP